MVHNKLRNKNGKLLHNYYSAQEGILLKWGTWGFRINVKALIVHMPFSHCFIFTVFKSTGCMHSSI